MPLFNFLEEPVLICKDHTVSGEKFQIRRDKELDLLATFPKPDEAKLPEYYKSEKYISHTDAGDSLMDKVYQKVKKVMLQKKLNWIHSEKGGEGRLLDFGAGTGDFLLEAKGKGWTVEGVEPNAEARGLAEAKGIRLKKDISAFEEGSFDVITLWHVLEHLPEPDLRIKEFQKLLKDDGLLVVAVPNFKSYDAYVYQDAWAAFDVPRHLYHFSRDAIKKIFKAQGLNLVQEKPLIFDAFYVSLLSEKIKGSSLGPLKALKTGLLSNWKAKSTGEYSSLTYFFRKS
jgi:2-polyprenyl-3-methyl-5-hydroxy-6-metoxy-1,4-benzoquinol methylase